MGGDKLVIEAANSRSVDVIILTPMNEAVKIMAKDLERQSTNIQVRAIELSSSRFNITVLIVDKKICLATELKDDSKSIPQEAISASIYSTSKSTVLSYVSMFESFLKLTELYEKSQSKLNDTTDELEIMKRYVNEVLKRWTSSRNQEVSSRMYVTIVMKVILVQSINMNGQFR